MKSTPGYYLTFMLCAILLLAACQKDVTEPTSADPNNKEPIADSGSKYEPPDGDCLFILGQSDENYMQAYMAKVRKNPAPAGFAFYTSLSDGAVKNDLPRYKAFLDKYPNTVLQLAIWTGERKWGDPGYYLDDIVNGRYDPHFHPLWLRV